MILRSNSLDYIFLQDGKDGESITGEDGKTLYTWVKYSQNSDGSNMTDDPTGAKYIGIAYNKESQTESSIKTDYAWSLIKGSDGLDAYTVILQNENISFSTNQSRIPLSNQSHSCEVVVMHGSRVRTDFTIGNLTNINGISSSISNRVITLSVSSSTSIPYDTGSITVPILIDGKTFNKIITFSLSKQGVTGAQGSTGVGIKNIAEHYAVSTSNSVVPTSWQNSVPTMTETNKYLWNYETITYTDNTTSDTKKRVIGAYGDRGGTGATGKGIESVTNYYLATASGSGVTVNTSGWTNTVQNVTASKKYLWNYEVITYTDNTTTSTDPCIIGAFGDTGKGIKSTAITYQAGTSGTVAPTGSWVTSIPTVAQGQYLWSRTIITYTDDTTSTTYSVAYIPTNGQNGAVGTGIQSIVQQYYLSTSKTTQTGGSWVTSMPTWTKGKYLWTRYMITYKNPTSTEYTSPVCDSSWEAANLVQDNLDNAVTTITTTMSGIDSKVNNNTKSITDKVWQSDITTAINNYDGTTVKTIRDQTAELTTSVGTITGKVTNVESILEIDENGNAIQTLKDQTAQMKLDSDGFKTEVSNTYATKDEVSSVESTLDQRADSIQQQVTDNSGNISSLTVSQNEIKQEIKDARGSSTTLKAKIDGIESTVTNTERNLQSQITQNADNITSTVQKIDGLEIGGRNYFSNRTSIAFNENNEYQLANYQNEGSFTQFYNLTKPMSEFVGKECVLSFDCISPNGSTPIMVYNRNGTPRYLMSATGIISPINTSWVHQELKINVTDNGNTNINVEQSDKIEIYCPNQIGCKVKNVKFEIGNKATDWTPAPEDVRSEIQQVSDSIVSTVVNSEEFSQLRQTANENSMEINNAKGSSTLKQRFDSLESTVSNTKTGLESKITQSAEGLQGIFKRIGMYDDNDSDPLNPNNPETSTTTKVSISGDGVIVEGDSTSGSIKTKIMNGIYGENEGGDDIFHLDQEGCHTGRVYVDRGIEAVGIKMVPTVIGGVKCWSYVRVGGSS